MPKVPLALSLLAALVLAGCSAKESSPVDFANADATQDGTGPFAVLRVYVQTNDGNPIPHAAVGAAEGSTALAKAYSGDDGWTRLVFEQGRTVQIVAAGAGYTTESDDVTLNADEDELAITLFPATVSRTFNVDIHATASGAAGDLSTGQDWYAHAEVIHANPSVNAMFLQRLASIEAYLTWTNEPPQAADLGLAFGCDDATAVIQSETGAVPTNLATMGAREVRLAWDPFPDDCSDAYVGPFVNSVATPTTVHVHVAYHFKGESTVQTVNL